LQAVVSGWRLAPAEAVETGAVRVEGDRVALERCLAMLDPSRTDHQQEAVHEESGADNNI
jgi:hypothetical protein